MAKKPKAEAAPEPKPALGQVVKGKAGGGGVYSTAGAMDFADFVPTGTFETYRKMRGHPTVALARAAAMAPIKAATWSVEADGDGWDDEVEFLQDVMTPIIDEIKREALRALDYGFQSGEIVWGLDEKRRVVVQMVKTFLPEKVKILTDEYGALLGIRTNGTDLIGAKAFVYTSDPEAGDHYGRSRMENIRENAWCPWIDVSKKQRQYFVKAAGIIPIARYPQGRSKAGDTGQDQDNGVFAQTLLRNLSKGDGVAFPTVLSEWAEEMAAKGVDIKDIAGWSLSFLESKGGAGSEFDTALRYYDSGICRGWLTPERSVIEGQFGTKAEAETHGDLAVLIAEEEHARIIQAINDQIVYRMLEMNFGREAAHSVRLKAAPLTDAEKALVKQIAMAVLTNPGNVDLLLAMVDLDSMLDQLGVPKRDVVVDPTAKPEADPNADPNAPKPEGDKPAEKPAPRAPGVLSLTFDAAMRNAIARRKR